MNIKQLTQRAMHIRNEYDKLTRKKGFKDRGLSENMQGFAIDVGELMQLIMAKEGYREAEVADNDKQIAHELSDCLWSLLVIA